MSNFGIGRKLARAAIVVFAAAIAMAGVTGEAAARHHRHVVHHHQPLSVGVQNAQAALNESSHLGVMRYYGGPKSPMWRAAQ
jgi:hypothetical protein